MELIVAGVFVLGNLLVCFVMVRWFLTQSVRKEDLKVHQQVIAEESLRKVEARLKHVEVEWEDTYEKMLKLFGRITRWTQEKFGNKEKMDGETPPKDADSKSPGKALGDPDRQALWQAYKSLYS